MPAFTKTELIVVLTILRGGVNICDHFIQRIGRICNQTKKISAHVLIFHQIIQKNN